jgi:hypothetical protein
MQTIPVGGTIPRCPHSCYVAPQDLKLGLSWGCGTCRQQFPPEAVAIGTFEMPRLNVREEGAMRANGHDPNACPKCESYFHYQVGPTKARCAECSHEYHLAQKARAPEEAVAA